MPFILLLEGTSKDLPKEPFEALRCHFTFPNHQCAPACATQFSLRSGVPLYGRVELVAPIVLPTGRHGRLATSRVTVPETAMDEHRNAARGENQIWAAWKVASVKAVPEAMIVQITANGHFWLCVFGPHPGHDLATFLCGEGVHWLSLPRPHGAQQFSLSFRFVFHWQCNHEMLFS